MKQIGTKINTIFFLLLLIAFPLLAQQAPEFSWSKTSGGLLKDYGNALTSDSEGNIYMTGEFFSASVNFGNGLILTGAGTSGNCDFFLTKFDKAGNALWAKKGGGTLTDRGYGVVIDSTGNLVVTGHYYGVATFDTVTRTSAGNLDVFTAKYDTSGNILWLREGKCGAQASARGLAYDNHGNTAIIGYFGSSTAPTGTFDNVILTTAGQRDIFLVKYNSDGVVQWGVSAGGIKSGEEGKAVACDATGNIYITGMFVDTATFGNTTLFGNGTDIFVAKYNPQGDLVWVKNAGGPKSDVGYSIAADNNGNVYVGGVIDSLATFGSTTVYANGDTLTDAFIAKYDANGNFQWVILVGGKDNDNCTQLNIDGDGNCLAFGNFRSTFSDGAKFGSTTLTATSLGYDDLFFMKVSPTSDVIWVKQAGGLDLDRITNATINSKGYILTTGYYKSYIKIGSDSLISVGNEDIFLSQIGNDIVPVELTNFSAKYDNRKIALSWTTATEKNNYGFEIQRSVDKSSFAKIGFIKGNGTTTNKNVYSFVDENATSEKTYYRLKQIDLDGTFTYSNIVEVNPQLPQNFELLQNYPNPFNPGTQIAFALPLAARVRLSIFNVLGELVETMIDKELAAGRHSVTFDASRFSSGVYLYKLSAVQNDGSAHSSIKKMIVTK